MTQPREDVFANLMAGLLTKDDVVVAISVHGGSGFSADLVKGIRYAKKTGAATIALVGFDGGILHKECDCSVLVPIDSTPQTEAIHVVIQHLLMQVIKDELAERGKMLKEQAMSIDVFCVGHAAFDKSLFLESFPHENSKCEITELLESGGGPAANAAYLLSLWGTKCGLAVLVGDDHYGKRICDELKAVGTDISLTEMRSDYATPFSVVLINKQNGSRTIVNRKLSGHPLQLTEAKLNRISPRLLLFDGHELSASLLALQAFPDAISILDAGSWRDGTVELAGKVSYLAASERFALQATGLANFDSDSSRRECIHYLRKKYSTKVIVTLGEQGLIADDGTGYFHLPAYLAKTVDTTAAGDVFHGRVDIRNNGIDVIYDSLRFASLTASLSVRVRGGRHSIPSLATVQREFEMSAENVFKDASLCVVGNINRDIKTAPFPAGEGLLRDGETGVASIQETIGGGGANSRFCRRGTRRESDVSWQNRI